jgi:O-antigen/teichoic acid export membrane protein
VKAAPSIRRPGRLFRNALWLTAGNGLRIALQAVYFVLIARILGARGYGAFAGVVALSAVLASFSGWGAGFLIIKSTARRPDRFPVYWARALLLVGISGAALTVGAMALSALLLPETIPPAVVLAVAVADLFFAPLVLICAQSFQAFQRLRETAMMFVLLAICRLTAALLMWRLVASPSPEDWAIFYVASSAAAAALCVVYVWKALGAPRLAGAGTASELREGFSFSLSLSAQRANNDIDKTLLVRLSTLEAAGVYSAVFRLVEVALMPVTALLAAAYARFFQHGEHGLVPSLQFARRLLMPALGYAVAAGGAIYLLAPLIPTILGADYAETVTAARWLAVLPVLATLYTVPGHALTGAGHQHARTWIEIAAVIINLGLNLWWIPVYSYYGAIWAMLISKLFAATGVICLALMLARPDTARLKRFVRD